uniref:DUF4192 domain-containing protein n=1 Tax=Janibacter limosus TaxID=53458 RepID=A0AC61U732_9MICO|nr:DUF4192 domain-containing protein [Janibacter limosus]
MTTFARPRNPLELAVLLPYQLGYHPGPSVVPVVMQESRFGMLQRHDLPDDPHDGLAVARHALSVAVREGATSIMLIAFEDDARESAPLVEALVAAADEVAVEVGLQLVVRDGHGHLTGQRGPTIVRPLPPPEDVPAVAPFVHAGVYPLPSRDHLIRGALPARDEHRAAAVAAAGRTSGAPDDKAVTQVWGRVLDPSAGALAVADLTDDELHLPGHVGARRRLARRAPRPSCAPAPSRGQPSPPPTSPGPATPAPGAPGQRGWTRPAVGTRDDLMAVRLRLRGADATGAPGADPLAPDHHGTPRVVDR